MSHSVDLYSCGCAPCFEADACSVCGVSTVWTNAAQTCRACAASPRSRRLSQPMSASPAARLEKARTAEQAARRHREAEVYQLRTCRRMTRRYLLMTAAAVAAFTVGVMLALAFHQSIRPWSVVAWVPVFAFCITSAVLHGKDIPRRRCDLQAATDEYAEALAKLLEVEASVPVDVAWPELLPAEQRPEDGDSAAAR